MAVIPDVDSLATYGGALENYGIGVIDPLTDRDALAMNRALATVAGMSHTAIRAWCRFTTAATTGGMVLVSHDAVWGNGSSVAPVLARSSAGVFTVTWPTTVTDELGVSHAVSFRCSLRPNVSSSTCYHANAVRTSANILTVYTFLANGTADDIAGTTVNVFVI